MLSAEAPMLVYVYVYVHVARDTCTPVDVI